MVYRRRRYRRRRQPLSRRFVTRRTFRRALVSRPPVEIKVKRYLEGSDVWGTQRWVAGLGAPWIYNHEPPLPTVGSTEDDRVGNKIQLKNWQLRFWPIANAFCDNDTQMLGGHEKLFFALSVLKKGKRHQNVGPPGVTDFFKVFPNGLLAGYGGWGSLARRTNPNDSDYKVLWSKWFPRDFPAMMRRLRTPWYLTTGQIFVGNSTPTLALNFKLKNAQLSWDYTDGGEPDYDRVYFSVIGHNPHTAGFGNVQLLYPDPTKDPVSNNFAYETLYFRDA